MAAYTVTAANVLPTKGASTIVTLICGAAAITQGQAVSKKISDGTAILANAATSAETAACIGFACNSASPGQPISIDTSDQTYTHGLATPVVGTPVFLSGTTSGAVGPASDLASTWFPVCMGYTISSTQMSLNPSTGATAHA